MGSAPPFPNDGSFLERFKQMQGAVAAPEQPTTTTSSSSSSIGAQPVNITIKKSSVVVKTAPAAADAAAPAPPPGAGNGKLTFSLKAKTKPAAINPLKLADDNEEEEEEQPKDGGAERQAKRQKFEGPEGSSATGPPPPADPDVKRVADKLASFVAKTGKEFEDITRQKNPSDPRFGFLFDVQSSDYKYYEHRLAEEELFLKSQSVSVSQSALPTRQQPYQQRSSQRPSLQTPASATNFQTPASALFENGEEAYDDEQDSAKQETNSLAMMEFYMKKAAQNDLRKPPKITKDEMPPPPSLSAPTAAQKRGHHMGDYIPQEELEKFMAKCNDAVAQKQMLEATERAKIQADNVGHRLLSKMGWKEGEGLGSAGVGRSAPVQAGQVKLNNLGLGAENPGEVKSEDDIYEQYKKRMMLGYRFRPNPLNNPRKAYY